MTMRSLLPALLLSLLFVGPQAQSETRRIDNWEIIYTVVNTTFVEPEVAARYQLVRAEDRAFVNIAVRELLPDGGSRAVTTRIEGRSWDLMQNQFLEFQEIREGDAVYYIADFEFTDGELRFFDLLLAPEGAERSSQIKFQHKVYAEQ